MDILNGNIITFIDGSCLLPEYYAINCGSMDVNKVKKLISNCTSIQDLIEKLDMKSGTCSIWRVDEVTHIYNSINKEGLV